MREHGGQTAPNQQVPWSPLPPASPLEAPAREIIPVPLRLPVSCRASSSPHSSEQSTQIVAGDKVETLTDTEGWQAKLEEYKVHT